MEQETGTAETARRSSTSSSEGGEEEGGGFPHPGIPPGGIMPAWAPGNIMPWGGMPGPPAPGNCCIMGWGMPPMAPIWETWNWALSRAWRSSLRWARATYRGFLHGGG